MPHQLQILVSIQVSFLTSNYQEGGVLPHEEFHPFEFYILTFRELQSLVSRYPLPASYQKYQDQNYKTRDTYRLQISSLPSSGILKVAQVHVAMDEQNLDFEGLLDLIFQRLE